MFAGKRNPVNVLFTLGAVGTLIAMHWIGFDLIFLEMSFIFLIGFFIFGPQMLIGMVAASW